MRKSLLSFILLAITFAVSAQDIHFSQYYASPLTLNPALTGKFNGTYRFQAIYRNQWASVTVPYVTYSGSADFGLFRNSLGNDVIGLGLMVYSDQSGDGHLTSQSVLLSLAYHKALDRDNRHQISLGFQGGMVQKRIDLGGLYFEDQWDGSGFGPPTSEILDDNMMYPDFNAGFLWNSNFSENFDLYAGFSYNHITEPNETFLGATNKLDSRYAFHAGMSIGIGDNLDLLPSVLYLSQTSAQEISTGAALGYQMTDETTLYFGGWYRFNDAFIPVAAIEFYGFRIGLSYDVNVSDLKAASRSMGAFEVSLIYQNIVESRHYNPVRYCPRF